MAKRILTTEFFNPPHVNILVTYSELHSIKDLQGAEAALFSRKDLPEAERISIQSLSEEAVARHEGVPFMYRSVFTSIACSYLRLSG